MKNSCRVWAIALTLLVPFLDLSCAEILGQQRPEPPRISLDTEDRVNKTLRNSAHIFFTHSGVEIEMAFNRETVPGDNFLTIWQRFPDFTSITSYDYLGHEGELIRFKHMREIERKGSPTERQKEMTVTLYAKDSNRSGGRFMFVPEVFQFTGWKFELVALTEEGFVGAILLDSKGAPR